MHRDAGLVEPEQHRLGLDAGDSQAHDVRKTSVAVAVERDARDLGGTVDEPLREPPRLLVLALEAGRQRRGGGAPADDRRHILEAGAARPLLVAAEQQRADAKPAPHEERAHPGRASHLVCAHRQQIDAEVVERHRHVPGGLRGVDVEEDTSFVAHVHDLRYGLHCADLVVAPLQVDQRGASGDRLAYSVDRHAPRRVAADPGDLGVGGGREPHRGVLDFGYDHVVAALGGPPRRRRDGLGRAAREDDFAVTRTEQAGNGVASVLHCDPRGVALGVDAGRVGREG